MTKEDILRAYLEDDLFIQNEYLKEGEAQQYKWSTDTNSNLIKVIKTAIEGEIMNESTNITERKINIFLNNQS